MSEGRQRDIFAETLREVAEIVRTSAEGLTVRRSSVILRTLN